MRRAFEDVVGRADMLEGFSFGGMTDYLIVRTALEGAGLAYREDLRDRLLDRYLDELSKELPGSDGYVIMPAVRAILESLQELAHVAVGLGTGNIERGARMKLEKGDLNRYFAFGGFGSDGEARDVVLRTGAARGAAELDLPLEECRIVVLGDTPRDIEAAHAIGATCIAVGTGVVAIEELYDKGAAMVCETLEDPRVMPHLVGNG